jgi:Mrp family chromosome partitioning ATPase
LTVRLIRLSRRCVAAHQFAFYHDGYRKPVVVVSGPTQDCGKTLVSTSLASIVAQAGQRVLFIDADMRKGMSTMCSG